MKILVDKHTVTIQKKEIVNEGEYNVQPCDFQFSSEYDGLPKIAIFKTDTVTKQILLSCNSCITPEEVLQTTGIVGLGVYAYENDGDNLILRYSPTPAVFTVEPGSYDEGDAPTPPTPSIVEQLQAQITENANNISSLQDVTSTHTTQIGTLQNDVSNIKAEQITQNTNIETNSNDIADIKAEQLIQNENISQNANNISTLQNDLSDEITNRQNADNNLQSQIDAITVSSDVIDVLGTYQDLVNYDTSHVKANDIIKVLQDSTHNNSMSYYRWVITQHVGAWVYVGSEGPYYTKSETDTLLQSKADVNDVYTKTQIDTTLENYATKTDIENFITEQEVDTKLENYVDTTTFNESQSIQDTNINLLQSLVNQMPTVEATGTDISLVDVLNYRLMKFLPQGSSSQDGEPTPTAPIPVKSVTGENSVEICNVNLFDGVIYKANYSVGSDGTLSSNTNYNLYKYNINQNSNFTIKLKNTDTNSRTSRAAAFDKNDNFIETLNTITISGQTTSSYSFTTPNNTSYILFHLPKLNSEVMLVKGSTAPSTYVPHEEQNYQVSLGNIELNSSPDGTIRDAIIGTPGNWFKREYIGKTIDASGSTSITINDMVSNGGFYSYYGGTLNDKTITYESAIPGENTIYYQKAEYTDVQITDTTLINQLNAIYKAHSYNGTTNITSTYEDGNEQMIIEAGALKNVWADLNTRLEILESEV